MSLSNVFLAVASFGNMETRGFLVGGCGLNVALAVASFGNHEKRGFLVEGNVFNCFLVVFLFENQKIQNPRAYVHRWLRWKRCGVVQKKSDLASFGIL